jgi:hypothetical protein
VVDYDLFLPLIFNFQNVGIEMADELSTSSTKLDMGFVRDDVRNQIAHSRAVLAQVDLLQRALPQIQDQSAKDLVQQAIDGLLEAANKMASNVAATTDSANVTISGTGFGFGHGGSLIFGGRGVGFGKRK